VIESDSPTAPSPPPRFGVCEFSTPDLDLEADLPLYAAVGATAFSPIETKVRAQGLDRSRRLIEASGLAVSHGMPAMISVLPHAVYSPQPLDLEARLASLLEAVDLFAALGARSMNCIAGTLTAGAEGRLRPRLVEGLRRLCERAGERGLAIGYEVVRSPSITNLEEAEALLAEVASDRLGLVVDPWHLWDVPGYPQGLRRFAGRLVSVQLSDSRKNPRSLQDRRLPGEGEGRLPELLRLTRELGYDGWYDLEIISDDGRSGHDFPDSLWKLRPEVFLQRARARFDAVWQESLRTD